MRESGILLHISSLPSPYGIGTFGKSAFDFVDFLHDTSQKYWQVLPMGPTSYGDSPYQTFSAFAGNPYFIDLDSLEAEGLINKKDLEQLIIKDSKTVDYEWLYNTRFIILRKAYKLFVSQNHLEELSKFKNDNSFWLDDFALFMAIKDQSPKGNWLAWDEKYIRREAKAIDEFKKLHHDDIDFWVFTQYIFFKQWERLKKYANSKGIKIIGDMPIYVALDSCDVWSDPKGWLLDEDLKPTVVAGVPPDYFSKTGQLWGNPIYNYPYMKEDGYSWWIKRIRESFKLYDVVRIDHFRGFEAYYSIPAKDKTAEFGKWNKGPGIELFNKVKEELGDLEIIAEDLGLLTEEVYKLLKESGYPGMKVLQFAFNPEEDSDYLPHNYPVNSICYTGTHDNMTMKEWLGTLTKKEKEFVYNYANINNDDEAVDKLIKCLLSSVASRAIVPLTDYLELGKEGRFNTPSTLGGNWTWRLQKSDLTKNLKMRILKNTKTYRR